MQEIYYLIKRLTAQVSLYPIQTLLNKDKLEIATKNCL